MRDAAQKAVAANPNLAESQYALGYLDWMLEWHWPAAESRFRRALEVDPRNAWAHTMLAHLLSQMARHNEALGETRRARELDPQNAITYALSSQVAFQARDYTAALDHASQAIVLDPELWIGQMMRGQTYEQSAAFEWLDRALEVHDVHLVYLTVDPKWDDYRGDPRFDALLKRCRFAADASAPAAP